MQAEPSVSNQGLPRPFIKFGPIGAKYLSIFLAILECSSVCGAHAVRLQRFKTYSSDMFIVDTQLELNHEDLGQLFIISTLK